MREIAIFVIFGIYCLRIRMEDFVVLQIRFRRLPLFWPLVFIVMMTISKLDAQEPIRILSLGDSYTIGEAVAESERWPIQLVDQLRQGNMKVEPPKS